MKRTKQRKVGRIKSAFLSWIGVPIELTDGDFWQSFFSTETPSGKCVTVNNALSLQAVWSCVKLLAGTISTLPLGLFERMTDGRKPATDHALYEILHNQPNADMTAVQFWECMLTSLLLWGNSFAEKKHMGSRLVAIDFLMPSRMRVRRLKSGAFEYSYYEWDGTTRKISEDNLWHVPAFSTDGRMGISPITAGANMFGTAMAADEAASSTFQNTLMPAVYFSMEQTLKADQRAQFRESLEALRGSLNSGKSPLLEGGMTAQAIGINPNDAQLLESRKWNAQTICGWFGVPPFMVGLPSDGQTNWGTGIEQQMIGFLTFSLRPWLTRIEQAIRRSLLTVTDRAKFFAEFNIEGLLRADSSARSAFYSTMAQNGFMTRNEGRAKENLPPMDGGGELTVQSNLVPLAQLGMQAPAESARNSLSNWMRGEET